MLSKALTKAKPMMTEALQGGRGILSMNYQQVKAIEKKNKERVLKLHPSIPETSGIYIYDQCLNELNSPANAGIQPQLPYTIGANRQNFKRLAINPINHQIAFCNNVVGSGAVYSVGMDNLKGTANNLISHIAEINNANALCFDKDGNLYVVANVVTNYTDGDIYKIASDGTYTKITPLRPDGKKIWVDEEIAIASDGRGGVWVAQKRA